MLTAFLLLTGMSLWGQECTMVSIDLSAQGFANQQSLDGVDITVNHDVTLTFHKGTNNNNVPKYYDVGTAVRCYGGNYFTVTTSSGYINSITLTFGSGDGSNAITTNVGAFESPTWSGEAATVNFTISGTSGNRRIKALEIMYCTGGTPTPTVNTPTFTPAGGIYYGPQTVTIACTTLGSTVRYTTDGTDPTENSSVYSTPLSINETTTVKAKAWKAGYDASAIASATYIISESPQTQSYTLITSSNGLIIGEKYIVVGIKGDSYKALGRQNTNNRVSADVVSIENVINATPATTNDDDAPFELTLGQENGHWTLFDEVNNGYLYAASSSANHLKTQPTNDANGEWEIEIDNNGVATIIAQGEYSHNWMRLNSSGTPFSCYISGQLDVYLYKAGDAPQPTPTLTVNPTSLSNFNYVFGNGPSDPQTFTVSGSSLTENVTVTAPDNFAICFTASGTYTSSLTLSPVEGTLSETTLYVRMIAGLASGDYSGNITVNCGELNKTVALSGTVSAMPTVATPTLSPAGGTYLEAQTVTIACTTEGATIRYTTDGNDPTENSPVYISALNLSETKTVKAKAWKSGYEASEIVTATYTFPTLITIAEARALENNEYALVQGVVTFIDIQNNGTANVYVQDETAGIDLYLNANTIPTELALGNLVKAYGKKAVYKGLVELSGIDGGDSSVFSILSSGNELPMTVKTVAEILEDHTGGGDLLQSTRVKIESATIGTINPSGNTILTQGGNTINIYKIPTLTNVEEGNIVDVTAVISCYNDLQLRVALAEDVVKLTVETPSFSPAEGTYTEAQTVTVTCATEGATIHYTLDGSDPTVNSAVYTEPLAIEETTTVKAFAVKDGYQASDIASATYTINIPVLTVSPTELSGFAYTFGSGPSQTQTFTVSGSNLTANVVVTAPETFEICLDAEGIYLENLTLEPEEGTVEATSVYVRMKAGLEVDNYSDILTVTCNDLSKTVALSGTVSAMPIAATPTFSPEGGTYTEAQTVTIACATDGATIRYTLDGTEPTETSSVYSTPLNISETTTVKAKAWMDGYQTSAVATAIFTIEIPDPVLTISATELSGFEYTEGSGPSEAQSFTVSGSNLTTDIVVTPPEDFEICLAAEGIYLESLTLEPEEGTVEATSIFVRMAAGLETGAHSGDITVACGELSENVALSGTVTVLPIAATPVFSPVGGTYSEAQTVTISCATEGAAIHYTLDGTDPTVNSTVYTEPLAIEETTTVKAFAVKDGYEASAIATAVYTIEMAPGMITIAAARALALDEYALVQGIVTFIEGKNVYIQDETAGIDLFLTSNAPSTLALGDTVQAYGKRAVYKGLVELTDINPNEAEQFSIVSSGNELPMAVKTIAEILADFNGNNMLQSTRVKIESATIGTVNPNNNTLLTQNGSSINIYKVPALTGIEEGDIVDVTAVIGCFNDPQLRVALASDVVLISQPDPVLTVSATELFGFSYSFGEGPSETQNFTVSGTNLTANVTVTAPEGFEVCLTTDGTFDGILTLIPEEGTLAATTVYVRMAEGLEVGDHYGDLTVASGDLNETIALSGTVSALPIAAIPAFSPEGGTYTEAQTVTISCTTEGAIIHYTMDGSEPTVNSTVYTEPLTIEETTTVKALAMKDGYLASAVAEATYTINIPVPVEDYVRITNVGNLVAGNRVILAARYNENASEYFAMTAQTSGKPEGVSFTSVTGDGETLPSVILDAEDSYYWTVAVDGDSFTFTNANGNVLGYTSSTNFATGGENTAWTVEYGTAEATAMVPGYSGFLVKNANVTNRVIALNSNHNFGPYHTQNIANEGYNFFIDIFMQGQSGTPVVATPTFSPAEGTYTEAQTVTITCTTDGATIRYTLDGTDPTENSPVYTEPLSVSVTTTLKAKAWKEGYDASAIATATYTIEIPEPVLAVAPNTLSGFSYLADEGPSDSQSFTVSGSNLTANVVVTATEGFEVSGAETGTYGGTLTLSPTDGTLSTTNVYVRLAAGLEVGDYSGDITVSCGELSETVALSGNVTAMPVVAIPTFSPEGGTYTEAQTVFISCTTEGATIHYTLDGTDPTVNSTVYGSPLAIAETTTVKAIAVKDGYQTSEIAEATYTINVPTPGGDYVRIDNVGNLVAGNKVILAARYNENANEYYAVANTLSSGKLNTTGFTSLTTNDGEVVSDDIKNAEESYYWTVEVTEGGYTFTNANGDVIGYGNSGTNFVMGGEKTDWTISEGVSSEAALVPNYQGFSIVNVTTDNRAFALRFYNESYIVGAYSTSNMGNSYAGEYNYFLDIFMQGEGGTPVVTTPTFSPAEGTYTEAQTVTIACATEGATIRYTLDGTDPTENSLVYTEVLTISETTTVKAKAWKEGYDASAIATATYTIEIAVPIITATPMVLSGFSYIEGNGPSAEQSFTVSGLNLTDNLTIAGTADFEISITSGANFIAQDIITLTPANGTVEATPIYVRMKAGLTVGSYEDDILIASTGANDLEITCTGTVVEQPQPSGNYVHITDVTAISDGIRVILAARYNENTNAYLAIGNTLSSGKLSTTEFTINGETLPTSIVDNEDSYYWTMSVTESGYTFTNANGQVIGYGNSGTNFVMGGEKTVWSISSGFSPETSLVPEYPGFNIINVTNDNRAFALRVTESDRIVKAYSTSNMASGEYNFFLDIFMSGEAPQPTPQLAVTTTSLSNFTYAYGEGPSSTQTCTVSGTLLTEDVTIAAPEHFEISLSTDGTFGNSLVLEPNEGTLEATAIYVRMMAGLDSGSYSGNLAFTSGNLSANVALSGSVGTMLVAATPTFSVEGGSYVAPQTVSISTTTPNATIYYTIDGTDPTVSSLVYTAPIEVATTMTLKAMATAENYINSAIAEATYTISEPQPISGIHDLPNNTYACMEGTVVMIDGRNVYVQDGTAGLDLYLNANTVPTELALGDLVRAYGKKTVYNGLIELTGINGSNPSEFAILSSGNPLPLDVHTIAEINDDYAGQNLLQSTRVRIENAIVGTINYSGLTVITQNRAQMNVYHLPYLEGLSEGDLVNINGVIGCYNAPQLLVASAADVEFVQGGHLTATPNSLTGLDYAYETGGPSELAYFLLSGVNLTDNASVYPSEHFEVSTYEGDLFIPEDPAIVYSTMGSFYDIEIYVRLKAGLEPGTYTEQLEITSEGAQTIYVTVTGTVTGDGPTPPPVSGDYVRISNLADLTAGSYVILAARYDETAQDYVALKNTLASGKLSTTEFSSQMSSGNEIIPASIANAENDYYWTVGITADGYTFTNANGDVIGYNSSTNFNMNGEKTDWTVSTGVSDANSMVPNYFGFNIVNVATDNRAFALNANHIVGAYHTQNMNNADYNFFLDLFVKGQGGGTLVVATPTFTPAGGTYNEVQTVSISCATEGATIHYTLDGTNPTESSPVYSTPLTIATTTTVKAMAVKEDYENSAIATATYVIQTGVVTIFNQDWEDGWHGWTQVSVAGDSTWRINQTSGNHYAYINAYQDVANEDWLLSPAFNVNEIGNPTLTFRTARKYTGPDIEVFFSNNYNGTNPSMATWQSLTCTLSTGNNWIWTESGDIDLSGFSGTNCYIGFKYTSIEGQAAGWEVDDIILTGQTSASAIMATPTTLAGFTYIEGNGPSAEQSFNVSAMNLTGNLSIHETAHYEISTSSGDDFDAETTITLVPTNGNIVETPIYVRLKADLPVGNYNSEAITLTSTGATTMNVVCNGSVTPQGGQTGDYVRIADVSALQDGNKVILASRFNEIANAYVALANTLSSGKINVTDFTSMMNGANEIIPADIVSSEDDFYWTVNVTAEGYSFTNANGQTISYNSSTNFNFTGDKTDWTITTGVSDEASLVPNYFGFNIVNVASDTRAFALRVTETDRKVGAYSTSNMTNGEYNFFLDIFMQGEGGTPTVAAPTFTPDGGTYYEAQEVTISCTTPGATIYYSLDSGITWYDYDEPIFVDHNMTIWAYAEKTGYLDSPVVSAQYIIQDDLVIIFNQDWEDGWHGWTQVSVEGEGAEWDIAEHNGNHYAFINAYQQGQNEDWLISPAFDLDSYDNEVLTFRTAKNYPGPDLEVYFSNDYDGQNPNAAVWHELECELSQGGWNWVESGEISLDGFTGSNCYIGFKYTSTEDLAAGWEVDDILLVSSGGSTNPTLTATPNSISGLSYVEGNGPSASQSYNLTGANLEGAGNIMVTVTEGFEISSNDIDFSNALEIAYANGQLVNQPVPIYVRLAAGLGIGNYEGFITHIGGGASTMVDVAGTVFSENEPYIIAVMPQYIQGNNGSNNNRVPVAIQVSVMNLEPNATYRYTNQFVDTNDGPETAGAGNVIYANEDGFYRSTNPSLSTEGNYGEFTTDDEGYAFVWFMNEPTANTRFTPGNHVYLRIRLNDGHEGTTVAHTFTSDDYATVLNFGTENDDTHGSAFYVKSNEAPMTFAQLFADELDNRPIYSTSIETTGVDYGSINQYANFYKDLVAGNDGWFGGILPNLNNDGVNYIVTWNMAGFMQHEYSSLQNGLWYPEANTANPTNGLDEPIFIDLTYDGVDEIETAHIQAWSAFHEFVIENSDSDHYNMTVYNMLGQPMMQEQINAGATQRVRHNLPSGLYILNFRNNKFNVSVKVIVR